METNIVITSKRSDPFARIPHTLLEDERLSWRSKGILSYLVGKPSGWKVRVSDLAKRGKEGERAIRTALRELRRFGYAVLVQLRSDNRIKEWTWKIADSPIYKEQDGRNVHVENEEVRSGHYSKKEGSKNDFRKNQPKESASASACADTGSFSANAEEFSAEWIPDGRTKEQKLKTIRPKIKYPSENVFFKWLESSNLNEVLDKRPDIYQTLCAHKWHRWNAKLGRWVPIRNWMAFITALDATIETATGR